jgi:hypothetical protein
MGRNSVDGGVHGDRVAKTSVEGEKIQLPPRSEMPPRITITETAHQVSGGILRIFCKPLLVLVMYPAPKRLIHPVHERETVLTMTRWSRISTHKIIK